MYLSDCIPSLLLLLAAGAPTATCTPLAAVVEQHRRPGAQSAGRASAAQATFARAMNARTTCCSAFARCAGRADGGAPGQAWRGHSKAFFAAVDDKRVRLVPHHDWGPWGLS